MKMYKSPASGQIRAEVIQAGGETVRIEIHKLANLIWIKAKIPEQWQESIIYDVMILPTVLGLRK
jgi:hypothetical protein